MEDKRYTLRKRFYDAATWPNSDIVATERKKSKSTKFKKTYYGCNF